MESPSNEVLQALATLCIWIHVVFRGYGELIAPFSIPLRAQELLQPQSTKETPRGGIATTKEALVLILNQCSNSVMDAVITKEHG